MFNYKNLIPKYNLLSQLLVCVFVFHSHNAASVTSVDSSSSDAYSYKMTDAEKERIKQRMIDKIKSMKSESNKKLAKGTPQPKAITTPQLITENSTNTDNEYDINTTSDITIPISEDIGLNEKDKSPTVIAKRTKKQKNAPTRFIEEPFNINVDKNAFVAFGFGGHKIRGGDAIGMYLSGITPISDTNWGVYGRGEIIKDLYKTGDFWSFKMAVGAGYYFSNDFIVTANVGKCFSNYSTCYFNTRQLNVNDDDINAIYYGIGTFVKAPYLNGLIELAVDWSPYKNYHGRSLYIGYAFRFK